jgi:hypothetical protein
MDFAKKNTDRPPVAVQPEIRGKFFFINEPLLLIIVVLAQEQGALGTSRLGGSEEKKARDQKKSRPIHEKNIIRYK